MSTLRALLVFSILILAWGCQSAPTRLESWREPSPKIKVLCTTSIIEDLVAQIGGDRIDHLCLMDSSMDPHSYELVKGDDEKFAVAQIVFCNGLGLEHSASLASQLKRHSYTVTLGDEIRRHSPHLILEERGQVDPHIWLDVDLWRHTIDPVVVHLSMIDPAGTDYYIQKGVEVKEKLHALDAWIQEKLSLIPNKNKYLVTSHDAFNYFTRRYLHNGQSWKDRFCAPEGLAPDGQLGFHDLQRVIDYLYKNQIRVLFPEANVSTDSLKKIIEICRKENIVIHLADERLYSDTLSDRHVEPCTYEDMMRHNVLVLYNAWSAL